MSFVSVVPDVVGTSATVLVNIGNTLADAHAAAAARTTSVLAAANDEVSIAIADVFSGHAQQYQGLSAQAAAFHNQFVQTLTAGAGSYALTEASSVNPLQSVEQLLFPVINAPFVRYTGRSLIGIGANAAPGSGQSGGAGGWLFGNGGAGGSG
ncbi:MAG: PE family protein, partial [Mycobacterium sp.]